MFAAALSHLEAFRAPVSSSGIVSVASCYAPLVGHPMVGLKGSGICNGIVCTFQGVWYAPTGRSLAAGLRQDPTGIYDSVQGACNDEAQDCLLGAWVFPQIHCTSQSLYHEHPCIMVQIQILE